MTNLTIEQSQNAVALAAKQMTQDLAEAHEAMGMIKAFSFVEKLLTVGTLKILRELKISKKYKGLSYIDQDGKVLTVGSWEQYCKACGLSVNKVDEDLQNLNAFGENFLEESQRLGLGYRDLRKLRKLPEEARAEIVDANYSEATDKEDLIEKIEELTVKHAKEKESLEAQLKTAKDNYTAQARVLDNKNKRIDQLDAELEKKKQYINTLTPDEKGGVLRKETSQLVYGAEAILRGQVWKAFATLDAHTEESGIDHKQFMTGVLAEIELVINELRTTFNLPQFADGDNTPAWARGNETPDYSDAFNAIINGEEQE
ncbi:hypothetical protein QQW82_02995 [Pasteurella multocida]|uniref:hypothetical protein n=1 Tax=Pasteurella multocida TaxID=747 RepID=UPI002D1EC80D|nr:hypothetical protein [Pasteurella multocida]MEB4585589.1 hypothetical protein [Pasteurella multocida]